MVVNPRQKKWSELTEDQKERRRAAAKLCRANTVLKEKANPEDYVEQHRRRRERSRKAYYENREQKLAEAIERYRNKLRVQPFPVI
jgi:hypothetical protein|tara:strand:- start:261 stop:518 length:258 start_codon:yes stop_codon:yes gene_type:complete